MAKKKLEWEVGAEFKAYGIYASIKIYRLAWLFNDNLNTNFCRVEDLKIDLSKNLEPSLHHFYTFGNEEQEWEFSLVQNKGSGGAIVKHKPLPLAILKLNGKWGTEYLENIVEFCEENKEILFCKEITMEEINNNDIIKYDV